MQNDATDIVARLQTGLIPSHESDLQVVHGLAAELRFIAHDHARDDGFVKFSGTRWLSYYHSLNRILIEHDRRQAEIYKSADEIERLREALRIECEELTACAIDRKETQRERDDARREVERLRAGGCARDQRTTQYCGEAVGLENRLKIATVERDWVREQLSAAIKQRDEARALFCRAMVDTQSVYQRQDGETVLVTDPADIARMRGWHLYENDSTKGGDST